MDREGGGAKNVLYFDILFTGIFGDFRPAELLYSCVNYSSDNLHSSWQKLHQGRQH